MKQLYKLLFIVGFIAFANHNFAQGYSAWSEVYNRNGTKVSISFRTSSTSCDQGGKTNKYRFNIEGNLPYGKKELLVTIKYINCQKNDAKEVKLLDIGTSGGAIGINENIDYVLTGDISERTVKAEENNPPPPPPSSSPSYSSASSTSSSSSSSSYSSSSSSSRKYKKFLGMRFGVNVGIDMGSRPMIANFTVNSTQSGSLGSNSFTGGGQKLVNPFGTGFRGDIMFHPLYRSNIHLGLFVGGAYGGSVAMINGGTWKSTSDAGDGKFTDVFDYKYSKFDFGIDFAVGWTAFKYLVRYSNSLQQHNFKYTRTSNYVGTDLTTRSEVIEDIADFGVRRETITLGFRINGKKGAKMGKKGQRSAPAVVDLFWNISRDNPWSWSSMDITASTKNWQVIGAGLSINIGKIIYIGGEFAVPVFKSANLPAEVITPSKSKNVYTQFTVGYNFTKGF